MAMIKINLLGKKKASAQGVPFGLDEKLSKLGIRVEDVQELRPQLVKVAILILGVYLAEYIPAYIHDQKAAELDAKIAALTGKSTELNKELASKKDLRRQMEELNKSEAELQRQLSAISALTKDRGLGFRTVDSVVSLLPSKVWLNTFTYNHRQTRVSGSSWEYFPINDYVKSITEASQFKEVIFRGIQTEPAKTRTPGVAEQLQRIKTFDLEFTAKGAEET